MPRVRCAECKAEWEQPAGVAVPHAHERHRDGCSAAPRDTARKYSLVDEPPDPYTTLGGTP